MSKWKIPTHPEGWKFKGAVGGYRVWHAGKNDYRVTSPGNGEVIARSDQFGKAFSRAQQMYALDPITAYYTDRANGCHAAKAP